MRVLVKHDEIVEMLIEKAAEDAELIIGIGSGVMQDLCKYVSFQAKLPYHIIATAPSMDGYASGTSSMAMDGLKVSLPSACANVIIGDIDILKELKEEQRLLILKKK